MFNIALLDENFKQLQVVTSFTNVLWTERFLLTGTFEIQAIGISNDVLQSAEYVFKSDSDYIGKIATYELTDIVILKGFFLENILKERFCIKSVNYTGNAETVIRNIVYDNCIADYPIPRLELSPVNNNNGGIVSVNMFGKNVLDEIQRLQLEHALGIKAFYDFNTEKIVFSVWQGTDKRANVLNPNYYDDDVTNILISRSMDNVLTEKYQIEELDVKNYAIVDGAGEGTARTRVIVDRSKGQPINMLYVDARDLQPVANQTTEQYRAVLQQRGHTKLDEYAERQTIEITIDYSKLYMLQLGDIVTYRNDKFDVIAEGQITEFQDVAGIETKKNVIIGRERLKIIQRLRREVQ